MMFFLFLRFFYHVHGACLEFPNGQLHNNCSLVESANQSASLERYYPECLQCQIQTWTESNDMSVEADSQCSSLELRCVQLKFSNQKIFEDFFREGYPHVYQLFYTANGTDQNPLHVILEEHTLEEINREYIERIFPLEPQAYRVLIFELSLRDSKVQVQQDLATITRLAIKIVLNCANQVRSLQTVYIIHNQQIVVEGKQDVCLSIFPPLPSTALSTALMKTTSGEVLFVSQKKSKDHTVIIALLTCVLLCVVITSLIYCLRRATKYHWKPGETDDTTSELTVSEDTSLETPLSLGETPKLSLKAKQPKRGMRTMQLLHYDI